MTGIADELRGPRRYGVHPKMEPILDAMSPADRDEWTAVLLDKEVMTIRICDKLNSMGHVISVATVGVYRRKLRRDLKG